MKPKRKSRSGPSTPQADRPGVRVEVRLPAELSSKLDAYCKRRGCARNEAIREAIACLL